MSSPGNLPADAPATVSVLPPPRVPGRYAVELVCLGNICRSPMAHVVLEDAVARAGLADRVRVTSSGTGGWHVGEPMDERAAATLAAAGYDPSRHRARQHGTDDGAGGPHHPGVDLVLAMDLANLAALGGPAERVRLFRELDPVGRAEAPAADPAGLLAGDPVAARVETREVPDPYHGGPEGFADVLATAERTSAALVGALEVLLAPPDAPDPLDPS